MERRIGRAKKDDSKTLNSSNIKLLLLRRISFIGGSLKPSILYHAGKIMALLAFHSMRKSAGTLFHFLLFLLLRKVLDTKCFVILK
jgi:hypothetical protein